MRLGPVIGFIEQGPLMSTCGSHPFRRNVGVCVCVCVCVCEHECVKPVRFEVVYDRT
jgi:hypothetical protein